MYFLEWGGMHAIRALCVYVKSQPHLRKGKGKKNLFSRGRPCFFFLIINV